MKEFFIIYRDPEIGSEVARLAFGKSLFHITEQYRNSGLDIVSVKEINLIGGYTNDQICVAY